jgi:hypothetical protein
MITGWDGHIGDENTRPWPSIITIEVGGILDNEAQL